jgi:murein DD-endopeptidase MepM/ murein hydrolase activator NlpD
MTNNGKPFVFLIRKSSQDRIFIRRICIGRGVVQNALLTVTFLFLTSLLGGGIYGIVTAAYSLDDSEIHTGNQTIAAMQPKIAPSDAAVNSGGPVYNDQSVTITAEEEKLQQSILNSLAPESLPNIWAREGKINNEFGFRRNPFGGRTYEFHAGMDIGGDRGDPVIAPGAGRVIEAGWKGGYGNMIEIDHGNGVTTRYGHLSKIEVEVGDIVTRGQIIGLVGSTGRSTGPHLHYELRINDRPINPRVLLPPEPKEIESEK